MNECEETNGGCEALCCNTIGSFYCKCPAGQELKEDGKTCQGESRLFFLGFSVQFMLFQQIDSVSKAALCKAVLVIPALEHQNGIKLYFLFVPFSYEIQNLQFPVWKSGINCYLESKFQFGISSRNLEQDIHYYYKRCIIISLFSKCLCRRQM